MKPFLPVIACLLSLATTVLQAPLQVRADATAWLSNEFQYTDGIHNASGKVVSMRVGTGRGIERGGFGHTNPDWPTAYEGKLYWMNGTGVLYTIDTTQPLDPDGGHADRFQHGST